jgi:gluconate 2-dehydrogenase gamma chain
MTGMKRRDVLKFGAFLPAAGVAQTPAPKAAEWTPSFFNAHQNDTITQFSDLVIPTTDTPGAKDALVNRYLDKILAASDHPFQNEFAGDLDALDRFSRQSAGSDFVRLTTDQQKSVLEKMFLSDQRPSFDRLKAWTARIYYASKPGFDELNKGGRVPGSFACA